MKAMKTMTVGELVAVLAKMDQGKPVGFSYGSGDYTKTVLVGTVRDADEKLVEWSEYHREWRLTHERDDIDPSSQVAVVLS